jgi:hypothetical protein
MVAVGSIHHLSDTRKPASS